MGHCFHFFPDPFPDETLHSVLARYAQLYGLRSPNGILTGALWGGNFSENVPFPCHLARLVDALPTQVGMTVSRLIDNHTLLPYYQPFLSVSQLQYAQSQMAFRGSGGLKLKLGLIASRLEHATRTRFCSACLKQDDACKGVAYWHRVHQLPGVLICPHHMEPLMVLDQRTLTCWRKRLLLPGHEAVQSRALALDISPERRRELFDIAKVSHEVLQANACPFRADRIQKLLVDGALALGLASGNGRLRLGSLGLHMNAFFNSLPSIGEYSILGNLQDDVPAPWVTKLLRKPRHTHHPLKFILLAIALKIDIVELLTEGDTHVEVDVAQCSSHLPSSIPLMEPSGEHEASSITSDVTTGLERDIWACAEKGMDAGEISAQLSVSLATVYRGVRGHEQGTEGWKQSRFKRGLNQRRSRFEQQYQDHQAHECSDYMWLYRNDRVWLTQQFSPPYRAGSTGESRSPFRDLDPSLASQIYECARNLRALPGKPIRVTQSRIGRELGSVARFEKQLQKLPLCAAALASVCESRDHFHMRRLQWAEQHLIGQGIPVTKALLYRTASIRPD